MPAHLSVADLAEKCQRQSERFRRALAQDTRFCLELFRRAFEAQSNDALTWILKVYYRLVLAWVTRHPGSKELSMPLEYYVYDCFSNFTLTMRDRQLSDFPELAHVLKFWKICTHNYIIQELRRQRVDLVPLPEPLPEPNPTRFDSEIIVAQIWERIAAVLTDPTEYLLAQLILEQDLKPRKIIKERPDLWPTVEDIRVVRQRMMRHLREDDWLAEVFDDLRG